MKKIDKYLGEAKKPKWYSNPFKFRDDLKKRLEKVAKKIDDIWISEDRYYPGDVDHNPEHYKSVNKALKTFDDAISSMEKMSK